MELIKKSLRRLSNALARQVNINISTLSSQINADMQVIHRQTQELNTVKMLVANDLSLKLKEKEQYNSLHEFEFKVFSQWGDDGIIQYLVNRLDISNKIFIEFGVENYTEANTRFLLINNNWSGLIMDGSQSHMDYVKHDDIYWKHDLKAKCAFITAENINSLIAEEGIQGEIGLLHIDIDGNDYWVWKAIKNISAVLVIVEYNSVFGIARPVTVPYQADFVRGMAHYSNLFYGTSLLSICDLAEEKGYYFIGCNSAGNNAYFVRKDKIAHLKPLTPQEGFVESKFREARNKEGKLTFTNRADRTKIISGLKVINTRTLQEEVL